MNQANLILVAACIIIGALVGYILEVKMRDDPREKERDYALNGNSFLDFLLGNAGLVYGGIISLIIVYPILASLLGTR